jgi:hypothetical protein
MNSDKWSADYKWIEKFLREITSKSSKQIKRRIKTPKRQEQRNENHIMEEI